MLFRKKKKLATATTKGVFSTKKKKSRYRVICHLQLNDDEVRKVEILTYAYSRRAAVERIQNQVTFKAVKAYKQKLKRK